MSRPHTHWIVRQPEPGETTLSQQEVRFGSRHDLIKPKPGRNTRQPRKGIPMFDQERGAELFAHPKNITIVRARVLWAGATTDASGNHHEAGWVLPGGERTQDKFVAHSVAHEIEEVLRRNFEARFA